MDVNIQRIQTAQLRQVGADETFHVKITPAIQASGLGDGGSFCFDIDSIEKYGKILAIGDSKTINENNREFTYNVRRGTENGNLWLPIPAEALSVLGVNLENGTLVNDAPRLTVWAGPASVLG